MEALISLIGFVLVSTITPGPNNFLLAASGVRFGVRRTIPHVIGVHCGIYILVALCGLGLGQVLVAVPGAILGLKVLGSAYLVYLAWKIIGFRLTDEHLQEVRQPMGVLQAGLFQFSNPKAWMMATTGINIALAFAPSMPTAVISLCLGFATLGAVCNFAWIWLGASMSRFLADPIWRYWINTGLSLITVITVAMLWVA
jgi:threonine/homoserine/homoserine lactone efflux protein